MDQEHERAVGGWQAEWEPWSDLLRVTGSAAAWARDLVERLEVDEARMLENLRRAGRETAPDDAGTARALVERALRAHRAMTA
jgi:3-carboxy-cis,cis-muconate cycloisomerase